MMQHQGDQSMDDVELTPSEREAFSRLAAAMPDNPSRPAAVRTLVRSRQRRRYAARAGLGVVAAAGAVSAGIVITNNRAAGPAQITAATDPSGATTLPAALDCAAVKAAAASNDTATSQPVAGGAKMHGKITAVTDVAISVHGDPGGSLTDITAGFAPGAIFVDAGRKSTTRPTLAVGDAVGLEATQAVDGTYSIDYLEVHVPDRATTINTGVDPGSPESKSGKGLGTVTAVSDSAITIQAAPDVALPNSQTSITAAFMQTTTYYDGNAQLSGKPSIAVGDSVAFSFAGNADGTFGLTSLQLGVSTTTSMQAGPVDPGSTFGKGYGTVTAVSDSTVTIQEAADVPLPNSQGSLTASFTATTSYYDADTQLSAKPNVAVGDQVAFAFTVAKDGTVSLTLLQLHGPAPIVNNETSGAAALKAAMKQCLAADATAVTKP